MCSSGRNRQVDSGASRRCLDVSFSSMTEWSVPYHHFLFRIFLLCPNIFLTWTNSERKSWSSSLCAPVEINASCLIMITSVVIIFCIVVIYTYGKSGNDWGRPFNSHIGYHNYCCCTPRITVAVERYRNANPLRRCNVRHSSWSIRVDILARTWVW